MGLFKRDPQARAAKQRERWIKRVPPEAAALAHEVWSAAGDEWGLGFIDRERFVEGTVETYGIVASGARGLRAGVAMTRVGALEAMLARLSGELPLSERWAPPTDDNRQASWFGSLADLEAKGWSVRCDSETYGVGQVTVTGCVAQGPEALLFTAVAGEKRYDAARQAMSDLIAGTLEPTAHWAPA